MSETRSFDAEYEAIIIGGRPAGASLAARLGARGVRVLVVDRATFPCGPQVPSCPTIHPGTMHLLDELGIPEQAYAGDAQRLNGLVMGFDGHFTTHIGIPQVHGRDYYLSINRSAFDQVLWRNLEQFPSVTARSGFTVTDLIKDGSGRVVGIQGRSGEGSEERLGARYVVGADGRFSFVARKVGARVTEENATTCSTTYFADWEGWDDQDGGRFDRARILSDGHGTNILIFPLVGGRATFVVHKRADQVQIDGDAEAWYHRVLRSFPQIAHLLRDARQVSRTVGLKQVGNRYLEPGGAGWVLIGDALHHKDPIDGQGIYDALIETRVLDEALLAWRTGGQDWETTLRRYQSGVNAATHSMYLATQKRLQRELYDAPPALVIDTLLRWMLTDQAYQRCFLEFLCRKSDPDRWLPARVVMGAVFRGILGDVRAWVGRSILGRPSPALIGPPR